MSTHKTAKFTEGKFDEAVAMLQQMASERDPRGKRRAPRLKVNFAVQIRTMTEHMFGKVIFAKLRDLSQRGMSAVLSEPIPEGCNFVVTLPGTNGKEQPLVCRVAHSAAQPDGTFLIGAEFIGMMSENLSNEVSTTSEQERISRSILG